MDFFESQDVARRKTKSLVAYFGLAVVCIILCVYLAFVVIFVGLRAHAERQRGGADGAPAQGFQLGPGLWHPQLFLWVTGGTILLISIGSAFKLNELGSGGESIALSFGGVRLDPGSATDLDEKKLLNIVEEMAIASGTPVPPVFLIDEDGINAFAAGYSPDDAVIGVTRGCIRALNRDELQGVVAHEFSHILNGDMRLNIRLMAVLAGILVISMVGYGVLRSVMFVPHHTSRRNDKGGGVIMILLLGVALLAIGWIGVLFGRLIKSAVSRQREYLADASAVQFTRNPGGIAGALKKIGGFTHGSRIQHRNAEEASHMFFGDALKPAWLASMATHPPLQDRILRIDPSFKGELEQFALEDVQLAADDGLAHVSGFAPGSAAAPADIRIDPDEIAAQVGNPTPAHIEFAAALHAALPEVLLNAAHEPYGARAVVYALLLDRDAAIRQTQLEQLAAHADAGVYDLTVAMLPALADLDAGSRLPLLDLAIPALRQLSKSQHKAFQDNLEVLIAADEQIDLFEYTLQIILKRHLDPDAAPKLRTKYYSLKPFANECSILLTALAHVGSRDEAEQRRAFDAGADRLKLKADSLQMLPAQSFGLTEIDNALTRLRQVSPAQKRKLIQMGAACVAADRLVTVEEAELLRAVGDALDCPIAPFLPGG